ncbi:unnamed protein product [Owenia fusiformis]|uniref:F-actin monooxygenase n=1 Tax=Owenia fusiformis TaxID=6347 RepID=A0A8J1XJQ4_OWEFU|nr:unnamed protein product [Owenia fusiformis]
MTGGGDKVSQLYDQFCNVQTCKGVLTTFHKLCDALDIKYTDHRGFYFRLRAKLRTWKAQSLWAKLDKRAMMKEYKKGTACLDSRVLIIGAGPCGLRMAIECALLGAKTVVIEKRDRFTRNNVLHLWPFLITDLKALGAKKFYGKFCAGQIDHISIRQLQCMLLKIACLVGVEVHTNTGFNDIIEPQENQKTGFRADVSPADSPVSEFEFDVLIGADGKRNTLTGFKRKEFRGKLAIAITANFTNRYTLQEQQVEEISGVSYIFNQKFFKDLYANTGIDLENIVYYKDDTHYFVMTAKKQSLLEKGVLIQDHADAVQLLDPANVRHDALLAYAKEAANVSTNYQLPDVEFAHNHYGQADVAMFDFTSMFAAENASRVIDRHGHKLLVGLVGDSLLEPFWPIGSGCARGFLGVFDAAFMIKQWSAGKMNPLQVLTERESIYQLLSQTTPENLNKNFNAYSIDPNTRYPNLNCQKFRPSQMKHLYDGDCSKYIKDIAEPLPKKKSRDFVDSYTLLRWVQKHIERYKRRVKVTDLTSSFKNGMAFCCLIHSFRPELIVMNDLQEDDCLKNNELAFDLLEREFGISPVMTAADWVAHDTPDKWTVVSYLLQIYDILKYERPAKVARSPTTLSPDEGDISRARSPRSTKQRLSILNKISNRLSKTKKERERERRVTRLETPKSPTSSYNEKENRQVGRLQDSNIIGLNQKQSFYTTPKRHIEDEAPFSDISSARQKIMDAYSYKRPELKPPPPMIDTGAEKTGIMETQQRLQESAKKKGVKTHDPTLVLTDANEAKRLFHVAATTEKVIKKKEEETPLSFGSGLAKKRIEENEDGVELTKFSRFDSVDSKLQSASKILEKGNAGNLDAGTRGNNRVTNLAQQLVSKLHEKKEEPAYKKLDRNFTGHLLKNVMVVGPSSEFCYFCKKRVYLAERQTSEGYFFHRGCLKCDFCSTALRIGSYAFDRSEDGDGKFYCIQHKGMVKRVRRKRSREYNEPLPPVPSIPPPKTPTNQPIPGQYTVGGLTVPSLDNIKTATPERAEFEMSFDGTLDDNEESEYECSLRASMSMDTIELDYSDEDSSDDEAFDEDDNRSVMTWDEAVDLADTLSRRHGSRNMLDFEDENEGETATETEESEYETDSDEETETETDPAVVVKMREKKPKPKKDKSDNLIGTFPQDKTPSPVRLSQQFAKESFYAAMSEPVRIDPWSLFGPSKPKEAPKVVVTEAADNVDKVDDDKTPEAETQPTPMEDDKVTDKDVKEINELIDNMENMEEEGEESSSDEYESNTVSESTTEASSRASTMPSSQASTLDRKARHADTIGTLDRLVHDAEIQLREVERANKMATLDRMALAAEQQLDEPVRHSTPLRDAHQPVKEHLDDGLEQLSGGEPMDKFATLDRMALAAEKEAGDGDNIDKYATLDKMVLAADDSLSKMVQSEAEDITVKTQEQTSEPEVEVAEAIQIDNDHDIDQLKVVDTDSNGVNPDVLHSTPNKDKYATLDRMVKAAEDDFQNDPFHIPELSEDDRRCTIDRMAIAAQRDLGNETIRMSPFAEEEDLSSQSEGSLCSLVEQYEQYMEDRAQSVASEKSEKSTNNEKPSKESTSKESSVESDRKLIVPSKESLEDLDQNNDKVIEPLEPRIQIDSVSSTDEVQSPVLAKANILGLLDQLQESRIDPSSGESSKESSLSRDYQPPKSSKESSLEPIRDSRESTPRRIIRPPSTDSVGLASSATDTDNELLNTASSYIETDDGIIIEKSMVPSVYPNHAKPDDKETIKSESDEATHEQNKDIMNNYDNVVLYDDKPADITSKEDVICKRNIIYTDLEETKALTKSFGKTREKRIHKGRDNLKTGADSDFTISTPSGSASSQSSLDIDIQSLNSTQDVKSLDTMVEDNMMVDNGYMDDTMAMLAANDSVFDIKVTPTKSADNTLTNETDDSIYVTPEVTPKKEEQNEQKESGTLPPLSMSRPESLDFGNESPNVGSPHVDAKRRFFCEAAKPVTINPQTLFGDEIKKPDAHDARFDKYFKKERTKLSVDEKLFNETDSKTDSTPEGSYSVEKNRKKIPADPQLANVHSPEPSCSNDVFFTPKTSIKSKPPRVPSVEDSPMEFKKPLDVNTKKRSLPRTPAESSQVDVSKKMLSKDEIKMLRENEREKLRSQARLRARLKSDEELGVQQTFTPRKVRSSSNASSLSSTSEDLVKRMRDFNSNEKDTPTVSGKSSTVSLEDIHLEESNTDDLKQENIEAPKPSNIAVKSIKDELASSSKSSIDSESPSMAKKSSNQVEEKEPTPGTSGLYKKKEEKDSPKIEVGKGNTSTDEVSPALTKKSKAKAKKEKKSKSPKVKGKSPKHDKESSEAISPSTEKKEKRKSWLAFLSPKDKRDKYIKTSSSEDKESSPAPGTTSNESTLEKKQKTPKDKSKPKTPKSKEKKKKKSKRTKEEDYDSEPLEGATGLSERVKAAKLKERLEKDPVFDTEECRARVEKVVAPKAREEEIYSDPDSDVYDTLSRSTKSDDRLSTGKRSMMSEDELTNEKIARKAQRSAMKQQRQKELKRLRMAQELQRQLEEVEVKQRELEERGIIVERALRGDGPESDRDEADLMQEWFSLVHEKNTMFRYESELMCHAKELELEDRQSRLEQKLRDQMLVDDGADCGDSKKSTTQIEEEKRVLEELMEVVEQRDQLVAMLDEDRLREQQEDNDLEAVMLKKGFQLSPVVYSNTKPRLI